MRSRKDIQTQQGLVSLQGAERRKMPCSRVGKAASGSDGDFRNGCSPAAQS